MDDVTKALDSQFRELLVAFRREVQTLVMVLNTYRYLHERRGDFLNELNLAPAFFQTVLVALRTTWVIRGYSLLIGGDKDEFTMKRFLGFVGANLELFSKEAYLRRRSLPYFGWQAEKHEAPTKETVRTDRRRIERLRANTSLRVLRQKFYGHFDPEYFFEPEQLGDAAPLPWDDLREIEEVLTDVLNRYSRAFDGEFYAFKPSNMLDFQNILDRLRQTPRASADDVIQ
jgi:HEPN superfamily AbiU2-like protein